MNQNSPVSPDFLAVFREHADPKGAMNFAQFMELALYHPLVGYYRQARTRIGYGDETDFFTASTSGPVFGEMITAACVTLLGEGGAEDYTFVELGAENGRSVLDEVAHPFAAKRSVGLGEPIKLTGKCVVFSNELFDAQPFRRFTFRAGAWRERGVVLQDQTLLEVELSLPVSADVVHRLPANASEGYRIDAPFAAATLAERIAAEPWSGLFVACDYGKSWRELVEACPEGTARAYRRHVQSCDLLAFPGEQDLTCHVCWDWLADALAKNGFPASTIDSQEAFFIRHAAKFIAATTAAEAAHFSRKKLSLMQLLHPTHLGQKFQVLSAKRSAWP